MAGEVSSTALTLDDLQQSRLENGEHDGHIVMHVQLRSCSWIPSSFVQYPSCGVEAVWEQKGFFDEDS
jgi:hypothetical protein